MKNVKVTDLTTEVMTMLAEYGTDIQDAMNDATVLAGKNAVKELRKTSPRKSGKYAKGWTIKTDKKPFGQVVVTLYNKLPHLPHLLEYGHAKVNGGRVDGIPHIWPAAKHAEESLLEAAEEAAKR